MAPAETRQIVALSSGLPELNQVVVLIIAAVPSLTGLLQHI